MSHKELKFNEDARRALERGVNRRVRAQREATHEAATAW